MADGHAKVLTEIDREARETGGRPARRVVWIDWDSGFKDSGLRVGDRVVGDGGEAYSAEQVEKGDTLGGAGQSRRWDRLGLVAGDELSVDVERTDGEHAGEVVRLTGRLVENRSYRDAEDRRSFGDDGPAHSEKDGFDYAWHPWYQKLQDLAQTVLAGWDYTASFDSRRYAERVEPFRDRVAFLEERYPGAFARAARADLDGMTAIVAGEPRELSDEDLAYRQLGDIRAERVTAAAEAAWEAFRGELGDDVLAAPLPLPDPFEEDVSAFVGRVVELPEIGDRDLLYETTRSWYRIGGGSRGTYLIDRHGDEIRGLYTASDHYVEKVDPLLDQRRITFVGRVEEKPVLAVDAVKNLTAVALAVRPMAALVKASGSADGRFFVDMRRPIEDDSDDTFAGEAALLASGRPRLTPDLDPAGVLDVFFQCLKLGDMETWMTCFADWKVRQWYARDDDGQEVAYPWLDRTWTTLNERDAVSVWDRSRKFLLEDVYDLEVAQVSEPRVVYDAALALPEMVDEDDPRVVEEVQALVDHVGKADDGYRTFAGAQLHRKWTLQRVDDGPWRITSAQPI